MDWRPEGTAVEQYIWLLFLSILVFLLLRNSEGTKNIINSLSYFAAQTATTAQGRYSQ